MENTNLKLAVAVIVAAILTGCGGSSLPPDIQPNLSTAVEIRGKLAIAGSGAAKVEEVIEFGGKFATLKGVVQIDGAAPANPMLEVTKDASVCKPGGKPVENKLVIVGPDGKGLANVLLYAEVRPEWCHESMVNGEGTKEFDQKNCLFLERIFAMQTTETLKILNSDTVGHNAAMLPGKSQQYNVTIASSGDAVYPYELKQEKSPFPVSCSVHPWMQSYMIFRDNGYFAVTKPDGSFELANLPAGVPIKITAWHEATKGIPSSAVTADPIAEGWNKRGAFTVNLKADTPEAVLNIAVNSSALSK